MKLAYTIVAATVALIVVIVKQVAPDFPLPENSYLDIALWLLLMLGVEVEGKPFAEAVRGFVAKLRAR